MILVSLYPIDPPPPRKPGRWEVIGAKWRSGLHSIGIVAIASGKDKERWKAYIGLGTGTDEETDAQKIADHGAKLDKVEACAFFPELDPDLFTY